MSSHQDAEDNASATTVKQNACLIVIDGWGMSTSADVTGDAVRNAKTPVMTRLTKDYPSMTIGAHGLAVGLPEGTDIREREGEGGCILTCPKLFRMTTYTGLMGNSEVAMSHDVDRL